MSNNIHTQPILLFPGEEDDFKKKNKIFKNK